MAIELEMLHLLQAGVIPDTVVTFVVAPDPTAFDYAAGTLQILVLVVGFFALATAALLAITLRKSIVALQATVDRLSADVKPLLSQATRLSEDAHDIVKTVRREVDKMADATGEIRERLLEVSDAAESRIDDVNALLTVLQDQVQDTALSAVAAVKGLRVSAVGIGEALGGKTPRSVSRRMAAKAARITARREARPFFEDEDDESDDAEDVIDELVDDVANAVGDDDIDDDIDDEIDDDIDDDTDDDIDDDTDDDIDDDIDDEADADAEDSRGRAHRPYYALDEAAEPDAAAGNGPAGDARDVDDVPRPRSRSARTRRNR